MNYISLYARARYTTALLLILLWGLMLFAHATPDKKGPTASKKVAPAPAKTSPAKNSKDKAASKTDQPVVAATKTKTPAIAAKTPVVAKKAAVKPTPSRITLTDATLRVQAQKAISRDNLANEDMFVREVSLAALGKRAGTVVVMNPKTGQVYSIVNQDWAVRAAFKPCSTIKIVTGLAGLSEGLIDPLQAMPVADRADPLNLGQALAISNNGYFQTIGTDLGFEKVLDYALLLGLGRKTGINLPAESSGRIPGRIPSYGVGRMSSHGDDFAVTPVQLAALIAAVANNGVLVQPHIGVGPRRVAYQPNSVRVPRWSWEQILPGLKGAVKYGTAHRAFDADNRIAGKTGSCIGQGSWLGLFTSYAPVSDPQVVVVVVMRGQNERGKYAADVAGKIHHALKGRFAYQRDEWTAGRDELPARPRNISRTVPRVVTSDDEGDAEEFDETDEQAPHRPDDGGKTRPRRTNRPR